MEGVPTNPTTAARKTTSPLDGFTGNITPPRVSPLYTLGLAVVALAMVLLPAVYLCLVGLTVWGVVYHVVHHAWILGAGASGMVVKLIAYFGPAIAGGILVFFMLKPLFAKKAERTELPSLDPAKEPLLFEFVKRICEQVRAPMPCRIDVDCQVNASASLRRGFWSRDLVLTIGLPLAAGLDLRQFAGVLAHEFGHFGQGAAMRLTYVIRQINFWFARVVFERDEWDQKLEASVRGLDIRIAIVLHAARGCIWLTRRILWVLMRAGHAISCFMMRQMEFDADSYCAKVSGSPTVEQIGRRLRELNIATQLAIQEAQQGWTSRRLPEDLPLLIQHKAGALPMDIRQKLAAAAVSEKTKWHSTHPCDKDRANAARALAEPGCFKGEWPATAIFSNFAETSRNATCFVYQKNWKLDLQPQNLIRSEEMLRESSANNEADAAIRAFYGEVSIGLAPLLPMADFSPPLDRGPVIAQWREARAQCERLRPEAEKASGECLAQQQRLIGMMTAWNLTRANFRLDAKAFALPAHAKSVAGQEQACKSAVETSAELIRNRTKEIEPFIAALRMRVTQAVRLSSELSAQNKDYLAELESIARTLPAVGATLDQLHQLGIRLRSLATLAQNSGRHNNPALIVSNMTRVAEELRQLVAEVQKSLGDLPYPLPHPRGQISLREYARYEMPCQNQYDSAYNEANAYQERLFTLHHRLMGRLLMLAYKSETELEKRMATKNA